MFGNGVVGSLVGSPPLLSRGVTRRAGGPLLPALRHTMQEVVAAASYRLARMTPEFIRWCMNSHALDGPIGIEELVHRPQFMAAAACRDMGLELFFPELGQNTRRAKAVCASCEVRGDCLSYAMADEDLTGVWGGTTAKERALLRRQAS